jgi:cytochrome c biogenesis protein CcdA
MFHQFRNALRPQNNNGASCTINITPEQAERRGLLWVIGAFLICPCHLPITLSLLGMLLGGTVIGAALAQYTWLAGTLITIVWLAATWRGLRHLRDARRFAQALTRRARGNT